MNITKIIIALIIVALISFAAYFGATSSPSYNDGLWWVPFIVAIPMTLFIGTYLYFVTKEVK